MKKYCLTKRAKEQVFDLLIGSTISIVAIALLLGLILLPFELFASVPDDVFSLIFSHIGIISWALVISGTLLVFKNWLFKNIVECGSIQ